MPKGVKMEKYRPKIHFSAEDYIINDPNGLVDYKGDKLIELLDFAN